MASHHWQSPILFFREDIFPLEETYLSDPDWDIFYDIYYRAHQIISKYESDQIDQESQIVRNYLLTVDALSKSLQPHFIKLIPDATSRGILNLSFAYRIKHGYQFFQSDNMQVNQWDLFFALVALYEIDTCMLIQSTIYSGKISYPNYHKREHFQACANHALEAVTYAENAENVAKEVELKVKENIRNKAKKGATKKHEKARHTYYRFIQFVNENNFLSIAAAARAFLIKVEGQDIGLKSTNAERALKDAYRDYEKGLRNFN